MFGAAFIVVPGGRLADLHVRRARALSARAAGVPAVSRRDAVLLRCSARRWSISWSCRCWCGSRSACSRRPAPGQAADRAVAEGRGISSLMMWLIFAFGVAFQLPVILTLLGRIGIITSRAAQREAALFHRRRLRDRGGAHAARRAQPAVARAAADAPLRGLDLVGAAGREAGAAAQRPATPPNAATPSRRSDHWRIIAPGRVDNSHGRACPGHPRPRAAAEQDVDARV